MTWKKESKVSKKEKDDEQTKNIQNIRQRIKKLRDELTPHSEISIEDKNTIENKQEISEREKRALEMNNLKAKLLKKGK